MHTNSGPPALAPFSEMNNSKVLVVLTKSSRCYVPIDDSPQIVINMLAEVSDSLQAVMLGEGGQKEKEYQTALERLEHEAQQWCSAGEG